jgi:hypothetical protein
MEYRVREAVLVKRNDRSIWHVTFAPLNGSKADEIMVEITPARLERMSFAAPYSLDEIEELGDPKRV